MLHLSSPKMTGGSGSCTEPWQQTAALPLPSALLMQDGCKTIGNEDSSFAPSKQEGCLQHSIRASSSDADCAKFPSEHLMRSSEVALAPPAALMGFSLLSSSNDSFMAAAGYDADCLLCGATPSRDDTASIVNRGLADDR